MSRMTKVLKEWFRHLGIAITMVLATIGIMWLFCFLMETISLIGAIVIDILLFIIVLNILVIPIKEITIINPYKNIATNVNKLFIILAC